MCKMTRILHVVTKMDMAGTETLLMNYYKKIDRHKVQFDFAVSTEEECSYDSEIIQMGGKIFHYPLYKGINHFTYVKWWKEFFAAHPEYKIVHGHIGSTAAIYLNIAKKYGCFTIAHSHATWGERNLHAVIYRLYSYPTRYVADYFFGCSKLALIDRYGNGVASNPKIASVMPNAIDANKFVYNEQYRNEVRQEYNIKKDEYVIGTVGRFSPPKNPLFIVEIVSILARKGEIFKFLWLGQGEMEAEIKQKIEVLNLQNYFILAGVRKDIFRVLQAMDVFVFPSIWEGLGISCIEAQAAGLPTLCSDKIPEDANITNLFVSLPIDNAEKWADEILTHKITKRMNCFESIKNAGYDIIESAKKIENFYLRLNS